MMVGSTFTNSSTQVVIPQTFYSVVLMFSHELSIHFDPRKTLGLRDATPAQAILQIAAPDTRGEIILIVTPYALQYYPAFEIGVVISVLTCN